MFLLVSGFLVFFQEPYIAFYSPLKGPVQPYRGFFKGPYAALYEQREKMVPAGITKNQTVKPQ